MLVNAIVLIILSAGPQSTKVTTSYGGTFASPTECAAAFEEFRAKLTKTNVPDTFFFGACITTPFKVPVT